MKRLLIYLLVLSVSCIYNLKLLSDTQNVRSCQIPSSSHSFYNYKGVYNFTGIDDGTSYFDWYINPPYLYDAGQGQVISGFNQHAKVYQVTGTFSGNTVKSIPLGTCPNTGQQIIECYMVVNNSYQAILSIGGIENAFFAVLAEDTQWYYRSTSLPEQPIDTNPVGTWVYVKFIVDFDANSIELYLDNNLEYTQNGFLSQLGGIGNASFGDMWQQPIEAYIDSLSYTWYPGYSEGDLLQLESTPFPIPPLVNDGDTLVLSNFENSIDSSNTGVSAISNGIAFTTEALTGNASLLMNANDYVEWHLNQTFTEGTFECYYRPTAIVEDTIILAATEGTYLYAFVRFRYGKLFAGVHNGSDWGNPLFGTSDIVVGVNYHVILSFGPQGRYFYLNDSLEASDPRATSGLYTAVDEFGLGKIDTYHPAGAAVGIYDEYRLSTIQRYVPLFPITSLLEPEVNDKVLTHFEGQINLGTDGSLLSSSGIVFTSEALFGEQAVLLDSNDYIEWYLDGMATEGTFEVFFKPTEIIDNTIIFAATDGDYLYAFVQFRYGKLFAGVHDGSTWGNPLLGISDIQVNILYHIALSYGPAGKYFYINGILEAAESSATTGLYSAVDEFGLGKIDINHPAGAAVGIYDDFRISSLQKFIPPEIPLQSDFDQDGVNDLQELFVFHSNVMNNNTDGDQISDFDEANTYGTDLCTNDTDADLLSDYDELFVHLTDPTNNDTDADLLSDYTELIVYTTDPSDNDTDADLLSDYDELMVYITDPTDNDTDADLLSDYDEVIVYFTDPTDNDTDADLLSDYDELFVHLTDPLKNDTDGDSYWDKMELDAGYDPKDPKSHPRSFNISAFPIYALITFSFIGIMFIIKRKRGNDL